MRRSPPQTLFDQSADNFSNITQRKKSINADSENSMAPLMKEIKSMFADLERRQDAKFESLKTVVSEIKEQTSEIQKSIDFMSEKYDQVVERMNVMETEMDENRDYIKSLESKIEILERGARARSIEIKNIPKLHEENNQNLRETVMKIGTLIDYTIKESDISNIFRMKYKRDNNSPATIVVDFVSAYSKDAMIKMSRDYNKKNLSKKLNTSLLGIAGPARPVFITEHLTYACNRLYYLARMLVKDKGYSYCWTYNGQVYVRKREGAPSIRIENETRLVTLRNEQ